MYCSWDFNYAKKNDEIFYVDWFNVFEESMICKE